MKNIYSDEEGRLIIVDLHTDENVVTIVALYGPNVDSPNFFAKIANELRQRQPHKILIGDFNLTLTVDIDRLNTFSNNTKARDEVLKLMEEFKL